MQKKELSIAFFNKELPSQCWNGVSIQVHRLANALVDRGHRVTCFSFSSAPREARYRVVSAPPRCSPGRVGGKFAPARWFASIDASGFDIRHYHGDDYLCRGGAGRVRTFYGSALYEALHARRTSRFLYQSLFYCFELVSCARGGTLTAISRSTQRVLPRPVEVIPCGVTAAFCPGGAKAPVPTIVFLGDLHSRKRGDRVLDAFARNVQPHLPAASLRMITGKGPRLPGVVWTGPLSESELIGELQRAWVYCSASSYEGFGVPLVEAMACGTAVVSVVNPGVREIAGTSGCAQLCHPRDLGRELLAVLGDHDLRRRLEAGGSTVARRYGMDQIASRYESLFYCSRGARGAEKGR